MGKKNNLYFSYYFITYLNEREKCKLTYPTLSHYLPKLHIIKVNDCMQSLRRKGDQQVTHQVVHKGAWSPPVFFFQILLSQFYYRGIYYAYIKYFQWSDKILMSILCYVNKNCVIFLFTGHTSRLLNRKFNIVWYKIRHDNT